jgi:hypothetical protein
MKPYDTRRDPWHDPKGETHKTVRRNRAKSARQQGWRDINRDTPIYWQPRA